MLSSKLRRMEAVACTQNWELGHDHNVHDVDTAEPPARADGGIEVWFANIDSLAAHLDAVTDIAAEGADIIALAEHCVASGDVQDTSAKFRAQHWSSHWRSGRVDAAGRTTGGVGVMLRQGLEFCPTHHPVTAEFEQLGRLMTGWVVQDGVTRFHLMVLYCVSDPYTPHNRDFSLRMQRALCEWRAIHKGQKVCCLGDFNMTMDEDVHLASWTLSSQYIDALQAFEKGECREATHVAGRSIDHILTSVQLNDCLEHASVDPLWRFPSHRAIRCRINPARETHASSDTKARQLRVPQRMPVTAGVKARLQSCHDPVGKAPLVAALQARDVNLALET
eukprot:5388335-Amphidinium_carterae.3